MRGISELVMVVVGESQYKQKGIRLINDVKGGVSGSLGASDK